MRYGVSRGVFSNEAGLGAAGISAACADTPDAVRQGYISMTGVFIDTIVICSLTGLAIASSGMLGQRDAQGELLNGTALMIAVSPHLAGLGNGCLHYLSHCLRLLQLLPGNIRERKPLNIWLEIVAGQGGIVCAMECLPFLGRSVRWKRYGISRISVTV